MSLLHSAVPHAPPPHPISAVAAPAPAVPAAFVPSAMPALLAAANSSPTAAIAATTAVAVSPALPPQPALNAPPLASASTSVSPSAASKHSVSPASSSDSSASSASSASSSLSAPSSDEALSGSSSSSTGSGSSSSGSAAVSDSSHVSSISSTAMSVNTYSAAAAADRQRAHVAEAAYRLLLSNIQQLTEQVAAGRAVTGLPEQVKKGLEDTLEKARRGWKKIKVERKKKRRRKRHMKERAMKQEVLHNHSLVQQAAAVAAASASASASAAAAAAAANTSQLAALTSLPPTPAQRATALGGSNILQVLSSTNEESGRKRRQLADSSEADTTADGEADEDEEDEEDEEAANDGQHVSHPLAFSSMPRLAVMSLTSPGSVPPLVASATSALSPAAPQTGLLQAAAAPPAYPPSGDSVSDAQAPVVMSCSKFPISVLNVPVQRQYTMTRKDSKRMKRPDKEELVNVTVRIMGTPDRQHLYFVAKDVCQLICLRKGSVAKAIHDFSATEKARMPVLCQRSSGSGCTQVLTVLTMAGVQRLMTNSRQPIARSVLQWLSERVTEIQAGQMPSIPFDPNTTMQTFTTESIPHTPHAAPTQQQPVASSSEPTAILFPPQPTQLPGPSSTMALYQQYGLGDLGVDVPVSPQIGLGGSRPSLSISNYPLFPLQSTQPTQHPSLTSVTQFANHAFLNQTGMSLPSFSPIASFTSPTTSSYPLPTLSQQQTPPTPQPPQPPSLLPLGYPSLLSQLMGGPAAGAGGSSAFAGAGGAGQHQAQSSGAGHPLFLSGGGGGVGLFSSFGHAAGSRQSTPQQQPGPGLNQAQLSQLIAAQQQSPVQQHQQLQQYQQHQQQQQQLHQRLADQQSAQQLGPSSLSHLAPHSLPASSHQRPSTASHLFLPAATAVASPYVSAPSTPLRNRPL